mmetsp:Transcript_30058/g.63711  ORF Transcript_30058/g.63711 Transcript_30058/m.63711 type:complete len:243 (+) Transcript_30058:3948-4676(+)
MPRSRRLTYPPRHGYILECPIRYWQVVALSGEHYPLGTLGQRCWYRPCWGYATPRPCIPPVLNSPDCFGATGHSDCPWLRQPPPHSSCSPRMEKRGASLAHYVVGRFPAWRPWDTSCENVASAVVPLPALNPTLCLRWDYFVNCRRKTSSLDSAPLPPPLPVVRAREEIPPICQVAAVVGRTLPAVSSMCRGSIPVDPLRRMQWCMATQASFPQIALRITCNGSGGQISSCPLSMPRSPHPV